MTGQCNEAGLTSEKLSHKEIDLDNSPLGTDFLPRRQHGGVFPDRTSYVQSRGPQSPEHGSQQGVVLHGMFKLLEVTGRESFSKPSSWLRLAATQPLSGRARYKFSPH